MLTILCQNKQHKKVIFISKNHTHIHTKQQDQSLTKIIQENRISVYYCYKTQFYNLVCIKHTLYGQKFVYTWPLHSCVLFEHPIPNLVPFLMLQ